jgi:hypothetical protein
LPYLCEGNLQQSYYYMLDYVFILKLKWDYGLDFSLLFRIYANNL